MSTVNGFDEREPQGTVVEGQVTEIDRDGGRLLLRTEDGLLPVQASPEALESVNVGDVVEVRITRSEGD